MSSEVDALAVGVSLPLVDSSLGMKLLPAVLSMTAGSVDVISFLGLGGLFAAHITGNLVILASRIVTGGEAPVAPMLSVPVFMVVLGLTRLLVDGLESIGLASLRPLLVLQLLLLIGFFTLSAAAGPHMDPNTTNAIIAGMFGVSAMAVQNALVQVSLKGAPSTAVMTTNVTRFVMDLGAVLLVRDSADVAKARRRAGDTWPAIIGFAVGCAFGAAGEAAFGLWSLVLPIGFALIALAISRSDSSARADLNPVRTLEPGLAAVSVPTHHAANMVDAGDPKAARMP
jgi:uncharacterized membrane protein YoaK (UPF0700 family)